MSDATDDALAHVDWNALAARVTAYRELTGDWGLLEDWLSGTAPDLTGAGGAISLGGGVAEPGVYTAGALRDLPAVTQTVAYTAGGTPVTDTYTGVLLRDLLADAGGGTTDSAAKNDLLAHYVVATGSDGHRAVFSLGELDPRSGDQQIAVAYEDTAGQLGPGGEDGFARVVVPGHAAGGRYVSNLVGIEVVDIDAGPAARDQVWG